MNRFPEAVLCTFVFAFAVVLPVAALAQTTTPRSETVLRQDNLVAWCIVPFDAKQRGPAERAEMVKRLGLSKVAYDWRNKHVAEFEEEILEYKKHDLEFFAFWSWHDAIEPLIKRYDIHPQIWRTAPSPPADTQSERIQEAAKKLLPLVEKTRGLGLKFGLYNHGGWGGEPRNLVAVCEYLRKEHAADHVGIVYNFHHGHGHVGDFSESLSRMKPYLLCLNLNGMADPAKVDTNQHEHKIKPIGSGELEFEMIHTVLNSDYAGPIGILGHRAEVDAEVAVKANLDGLDAYWLTIQNTIGK